jgi:hypothetical protein
MDARAITGCLPPQSTVEPPLIELEVAYLLESDSPWHAQRLPLLKECAHTRLGSLSRRLGDGDAEWLEDSFTGQSHGGRCTIQNQRSGLSTTTRTCVPMFPVA